MRMVDSGEREIVVEEFAKFCGKGGCKLQAMIRDDFVVKFKV